ncbi:RICIN domain-containing protein [Kribbella sp. CA-294648]|uniref:RICIN domain-containing protein n=1 Tax=Kribbella sp. CA-294648 TaxID=3239948 RepID=UPI003D8F8B80
MKFPFTRRTALMAGATVIAGVSFVQPSYAADTFRTLADGSRVSADLKQFEPASARNNTPIQFVKAFTPDRRFTGANVGDPNTPKTLQWAEIPAPNTGFRLLRNRATRLCLDIELGREAGLAGGSDQSGGVGARLVARQCDGSLSQQWKDLSRGQTNPHTFQNNWTKLIFTKSGTAATLQPIARGLTNQKFFQRFVEIG